MVVVLALAAPAGARAQGASNVAAAEALFKQARELMAAGNFTAACPKLAESQRLDPGVGTLLNLASCYEKNGQLASAWATYKLAESAASQAGEADRVKAAKARAAALDAKLPTLAVVVPSAADRPDLVVTRDGEALGRAAWATPIPVDAGVHVVKATAPGRKPWQSEAQVAAAGTGSHVSVEVPALEAEVVVPAPVVAPAPAPSSAPTSLPGPTPSPESPAPGGTQRLLGLLLGGAGVVGLGVGAGFGVAAKTTNQGIGSNCGSGVCNTQGVASLGQAHSDATASNIAFAAGGAALLGGAILYLTAPSRAAGPGVGVAPAVGPRSAALVVAGSWR